MKIMECVPNFSEGRNVKIVKSIVAEAQKTKDVKILDFSMDEDHNRSVLTLIGKPGPLEEAVLASCTRAVALIDMRFQKGVHPRIGAVDVVPFIPFGDSTMEEAIEAAHRFGKRFGNECGVSVYFYGKAALIP